MLHFRSAIFALLVPACLAGTLLAACSQANDGAMDLNPSGETQSGTGFYLAAELDSSRRYHLSQDTLFLRLDSLWAVSSCFLDSLVRHDSLVNDTTLFLRYEVLLRSTGDPLCATSMFVPDTLLRIPMQADWSLVRQIIVTGTTLDAVYPDTVKADTGARNNPYLDSIRVRRGTLAVDTTYFYLDSSFFFLDSMPRRTPGDTTLLYRQDSLTIDTIPWLPLPATCAQVKDNCPTRPDTVWPEDWYVSTKAIYIVVRPVCKDSLRTFCTTYQNDSAQVGDTLYYADSTHHNSLYYIEKTSNCSGLDTWSKLRGSAVAKNSVSVIRKAFYPAANEPDCAAGVVPGRFLINVSTGLEVLDTTIAQEILDDADRASIADTLP